MKFITFYQNRRLEKVFLYLLIFLLPFNLKKFIFNPFHPQVLTEFSAIFLYLSDILLLALFCLWCFRSRKKNNPCSFFKEIPLALIFIILLALSLAISQKLSLSVYFLTRIILGLGLFFYLKFNLNKKDLLTLLKIISLGGVIQSLIALAQQIRQSSLGLWWLGETIIHPELLGIAKIDLWQTKIIRSYGTFAHPNLLACFLLFALYSVLYLSLKHKREYLFCAPIIVLGLILSFSRVVLCLGILSILALWGYYLFRSGRKMIFSPFLVLLVSLILFTLIFFPYLTERFNVQPKDQSVSLRLFYYKTGFELIKKSPLRGVGLGNFILALEKDYPYLEIWRYQPVHNIYLLLASETGLLTLIIFLAFLFSIFWQARLTSCVFVSLGLVFLLIGLTDHFFFTINQGILIFWLALGLTSSSQSKNKLNICLP